jgi:predicted chitinase
MNRGFTRLSERLVYSAERIKAIFGQGKAGIAPASRRWRAARRTSATREARQLRLCEPHGQRPAGERRRLAAPRLWAFPAHRQEQSGAFGEAIGMPLEQVPDYLRTINGGAMSMCWFFKVNGLEDLAATPGVDDETRAVNGGLIGLEDRKQRFDAVVAEMMRRGA